MPKSGNASRWGPKFTASLRLLGLQVALAKVLPVSSVLLAEVGQKREALRRVQVYRSRIHRPRLRNRDASDWISAKKILENH